jgi:hypothetical protein
MSKSRRRLAKHLTCLLAEIIISVIGMESQNVGTKSAEEGPVDHLQGKAKGNRGTTQKAHPNRTGKYY